MAKRKLVIDDDSFLKEMARQTGRQEVVEVVHDALALYQKMISLVAEDKKFFVGTNNNSVGEFIVETLEIARVKSSFNKTK